MDENPYFRFSASLRVMEAPELHHEIEVVTSLKPSQVHCKGDLKYPGKSYVWENDIWMLDSPLDRKLELTDHLNWLWNTIKPHSAYFKSLLENGIHVDVFCGYRSDCDHAGFEVQPDALEIFTKLHIPFGVSCVIA